MAETRFKIVAATIALITCVLLFTQWQYFPISRKPTSIILDRQDLAAYDRNITTRANDRNDAVPGWSSPLSTYLATPFDQLDDKGKAVVIGKQMVCMLDEDLESTHSPQSSFTDPKDLDKARHGWTYSRVAIADHGDDFLSDTVHSTKSQANGIIYPVSWGTYQSLFNLRDGVIVATTNYGPAFQNGNLELGIPSHKLVPLRQWSDLVFLALQKTIAEVGTGSVKGINHVFRHNLINDEMKEKLAMITGGTDIYDYPGKWPGLSYPITETQALAALSTANGKGVAYLLGTHKSQMGIRAIDRVNIFNCPGLYGGEEGPQWCLYLHVVDGPLAS
ncbi:hypothetical protein M409DRAFT_22692 [Zasmidium cellare ATCC 36951]|uniref:Uncharacterized protein n=1 Tax=Zasmidium cellare ATCC 36951 TaxID=1080233 RepID=A0A6A6CJE3_ZASCE|nr:uncharacterized protein M409DRAFT_22692 [Zasmidium cellare ATCC 36951]KAF2167265.1 hypothetical protein M409DRAFT_22692 [Zasmidium cellare ATCC 36951]